MDGHVPFRRAHVLAKGDNIDVYLSEFVQCLPQLLLCLSEAEHDGSLRDEVRLCSFGSFEHTQRLPEGRPSVSHLRSQGLDSLDIMGVDVQSTSGHEGNHFQVAGVIAGKTLN